MAILNKFNDVTEQIIRGIHDFDNHTFKVCLTNTIPLVSNTIKSNITEINTTGGYVSGGYTTTLSISETNGVTSVMGTQVTINATGASIGPFRYGVIYNDTTTNKNLIGWFDFGSNRTLQNGESATIRFNQSSPGLIFTLT